MEFAIIGKKVGMTTIFDKYVVKPVTIVEVGNNVVARKVTLDDGRKALVIGFGKKEKPTKPELGQYKKLGYVPAKLVQIIVTDEIFEKYKEGDVLSKEVIEGLFRQNTEDDKAPVKVHVTGVSKGKGFAGVIKRWGFHRQPKTHGQSDRERHPGSIGPQTPGRVFKGKKMAGRMGQDTVTVRNLEVVDLLEKDQKLYMLLKGAVPGVRNSYVVIKFE